MKVRTVTGTVWDGRTEAGLCVSRPDWDPEHPDRERWDEDARDMITRALRADGVTGPIGWMYGWYEERNPGTEDGS